MIERLPSGRDYIDDDGDIRNIADLHDNDINEIASHYDDLPVEDRKQFDRAIYRIEATESDTEQAKAFGEGVLFLLESERQEADVARSVREHPSAQNIEPAQLRDVVAEIVAAYDEEVNRQQRLKSKKKPSLKTIQRQALIAASRNHMTPEQITQLKREIGVIGADDQADTERPRDWFEVQSNDP